MPPRRNYNIFQGGTFNPQAQNFNPQSGAAPRRLTVQPRLQGPGAISGTITPPRPRVQAATTQESEVDRLRRQIEALSNEIASARQPLAAPINVGNIFSRAQQQAVTAQTPQFNKERELFVNRISQRRGEARAEAQASEEQLVEELNFLLEDVETGRGRTTQDVERNIGEIDVSEEQFQEDESLLFQEERTALAEGVAEAGLTASGLGRQQTRQVEEQRNIASERTLETLEGKREAQEIFRTRTFEDYETTEKRERARTDNENQAIRRQLSRELNKIAYEEVAGVRSLEREFQRDVLADQGNRARIIFEQELAGISDPRVREATRAAYAGFF